MALETVDQGTWRMASVLRAPQLVEHGFAHGFSLRQGGVSRAAYASLNLGPAVGDDPSCVRENLRRFAAAVGYAPADLFEVSQVHGPAVVTLQPSDAPERVRRQSADALVAGGGRAIGVRTADCVPLLIADPVTRTVAAVHAGWRGAVNGVVAAGVRALCECARAPAERLRAAIFPHIRTCCFEVGDDVAQQLAAAAPGVRVVMRGHGKPTAALAELVRAQLIAQGLTPAHLDDVPGCTRCDAQRFFSFRRDGRASGRHLTAIVAA